MAEFIEHFQEVADVPGNSVERGDQKGHRREACSHLQGAGRVLDISILHRTWLCNQVAAGCPVGARFSEWNWNH
jgi:hypothetical protein